MRPIFLLLVLFLVLLSSPSLWHHESAGVGTLVEAAKKFHGWNPTKGKPRQTSGERVEGVPLTEQRYSGPRGPTGDGGYEDEDQEDEGQEGGAPSDLGGGDTPNLDPCLKRVLRFCGFSAMESDFSEYISCIAKNAERVKEDCREWALDHRPCAPEVRSLCPKQPPPQTTDCIMSSKDEFTEECKTTRFFKEMVEGYDEFKAHQKKMGGDPREQPEGAQEDFYGQQGGQDQQGPPPGGEERGEM